MVDLLDVFPAVVVAGTSILVGRARPVAVLRSPQAADRFITWPDLQTGAATPGVRLIPAPDGAWVHYARWNGVADDSPLARYLNQVDAPALHLRPDGGHDVVRVGSSQSVGATRHGLWTSDRGAPLVDETYRGEELPDDWADETVLAVHGPGGTRRSVVVDRHVLAVFEADGGIQLLVHPSPPLAVPQGRGVSFEYRLSRLTLPVDVPLPAHVRFRDLVPEGWGEPVSLDTVADAIPRPAWVASEGGERVDATGVPGTRWRCLPLPAGAEQAAVDAAVALFANVERYWRSADGSLSPLARGLSDSVVVVAGAWPETRVVVTFRHPRFPGGRLRRTVRVFDDAGRIDFDDSAAIWLMEDLDTAALPAPDTARDGVLDI